MWVFDTRALLAVEDVAVDAHAVFTAMTALTNGHDLCFCNPVLRELARLGKDTSALLWAEAVQAARVHREAQWNFILWVEQDFPGIVDVTALPTQESAAVYVVAQALDLAHQNYDVTVVTEDRFPKPTRAAIVSACEHFEVLEMSCSQFLKANGLPVV